MDKNIIPVTPNQAQALTDYLIQHVHEIARPNLNASQIGKQKLLHPMVVVNTPTGTLAVEDPTTGATYYAVPYSQHLLSSALEWAPQHDKTPHTLIGKFEKKIKDML